MMAFRTLPTFCPPMPRSAEAFWSGRTGTLQGAPAPAMRLSSVLAPVAVLLMGLSLVQPAAAQGTIDRDHVP